MELDLNTLRSATTVVSLITFLALVGRAWSKRRQREFDEAAQLPFVDSVAASRGNSDSH